MWWCPEVAPPRKSLSMGPRLCSTEAFRVQIQSETREIHVALQPERLKYHHRYDEHPEAEEGGVIADHNRTPGLHPAG